MTNETIENTSERTAIITGGSRGIGRNTAVNLARRGVDIIFTYHSNRAEAESLIREVEAIGRKVAAYRLDTGDVSSFSQFLAEVRNTLQNWGRDRFDYLVNNAGISLHATFEQTTEAEFDEVINVHLKRRLLPHPKAPIGDQ